MNFKTFLLESTTISSHPVRILTDNEIEIVRDYQHIFKFIHDLLKIKNMTIDDLRHCVVTLEPYQHYKTGQFVLSIAKDLLQQHGKMINASATRKMHIGEIKSLANNLKHTILNNIRHKSNEHSVKLNKLLSDIDIHVDAPEEFKRFLSSKFKHENSIFSIERIISPLGNNEYEKIERINTGGPLYTAIDIPDSNNIDHILFFLLHLQDTNINKNFNVSNKSELRNFQTVKHANNENYTKLLSLVNRYLSDNHKSLLPEIARLIELIPEIKAVNDNMKSKIKLVYRGIPADDYTEEEIIDRDLKSKYVATSTRYTAAANFALRIGHMENEIDRRSETGFILTYAVTPSAILFDTSILKTIFNESEVVIDTTKAELHESKEV